MLRYIDFSAPPQADFINALSLAAATAKATTIPTGAKFVLITPGAASYFRISAAAAATVPGDVADGSASELIPLNGSVLRAIVPAVTKGSITTGTALLTVASTDGITIGDTLVVKGAGVASADLTQTVSAINFATRVVTLGGNASTTVVGAVVTETLSQVSVISPSVCVVTLAFYK
jgi:hypothetical protein